PISNLFRHLSWGDDPAIALDSPLWTHGITDFLKRARKQVGGWEPDGTTPVGIATLDLDGRFRRLVADLLVPKAKRIFLVMLREAANSVVGEKFFLVPDALEDGFELIFFKDGEDLRVTAGISITAHGEVRTLGDEPFDAGREFG